MLDKAVNPSVSFGPALRAGGAVGMLVAAFFVYAVPYFLAAKFSVNVPAAWGLGDFSFVLCAIGAVVGMFFYQRITRTRF
jgi:hypothetical protein